ncbi:Ubiquinol oxidase subunit 2 precursor [Providencia stuartii]|nr:Ubiquinol oxidase subunit 2 precursor [Providencia stuartii]
MLSQHLNRQGFDEWVQKVKASPKTMDTMQAFDEVAKPSMNVPVTYFSSVKPNLYEDIILKFGHEHHKGHAPADKKDETAGQSMHMSHNAHTGTEE